MSDHRHPRLRYILKVAAEELGWRIQLFIDRAKWRAAPTDYRVSFAATATDDRCLCYQPHPLLSGRPPAAGDLVVTPAAGLPTFFPTPGGAYDPLACAFYAIVRYEEYAPFTADAHGRFPAAASHARRHGYLGRPVVRLWLRDWAARLRAHYPTLPAPRTPDWTVRPTYDIDLLWAWRHRGWRGLAAGVRDLGRGHFRRAWDRFAPGADPFDTIALLQSLHLRQRLQPTFFWLLSDRRDRHDVNPYPIPEAQRAVMRQLAAAHTVGLHPSYRTVDNAELIRTEAARFAEAVGRAPRHARQHFLRLRLPDTYRALRDAGITHDHTMGYADAIGWRAGTNRPFRWYDLEREEETGLTVHPFAAMDVTLKNYLGLDAAGAQRAVRDLAAAVRPLGGEFALLWHNSSFSAAYGWAGWWAAYADLLAALATEGGTGP